MKQSIVAMIVLFVALLAVPVKSDAQVIRIEKSIIGSFEAKDSAFVRSTPVKVKIVDPSVPRAAHLELADAMPDSVRVSWYTQTKSDTITANDTLAVQVSLLAHQVGAPYVTTVLDTISGHEADYVTIPGMTFASMDEFGIAFTALNSGNAVVSKNRQRFFARVEWFFHE